jgi:hypothetical protein
MSTSAVASRPSPPHAPSPSHVAANAEGFRTTGSRPVVGVASTDEALQQHLRQCNRQRTAAFRIAGWAQRVHAALLPRFVTTATTAAVLTVALLLWV